MIDEKKLLEWMDEHVEVVKISLSEWGDVAISVVRFADLKEAIDKGELDASSPLSESIPVVWEVEATQMTDTRMDHQESREISLGFFRDKGIAESVAKEINKTNRLPDWFTEKRPDLRRGMTFWDGARVYTIQVDKNIKKMEKARQR